MFQRLVVVVVIGFLALTGCERHAATLSETVPASSSTLPRPAPPQRPSGAPATPPRSRSTPSPATTTPELENSPVITPSITSLIDPTSRLTAVSFVDSQYGWIGFGTSLLATTDGGQQWHTIFTAPEPIDALDFVSTQQGWALMGEHVVATLDGGTTWTQVTPDHTGHLYTVDFVDAAHGWVATTTGDEGGSLLRTTDGGRTWETVVHPCGLLLNGYYPGPLSFIDPLLGRVMCVTNAAGGMQGKELFGTSDGGRQWTSIVRAEENVQGQNRLDQSGYLNALFFLDVTHGWSNARFIESGALLGSADGGQTWQDWNLSAYGRTVDVIRFISPTQGYVITNGRALVTTNDGGNSWTQLYPAIAPQGMIQFFDQQHGIATGSPLDPYAILQTDDGGRSWTPIASVQIDSVRFRLLC